MKKRYLSEQIVKDIKNKMVFLGGPRQVGKTTLALDLFEKESYLNCDAFKLLPEILSGL